MSYDFTKLSRVPINDSVTDETYTLVVNQDEVERTPYGNVISNIQDYTEDYNAYSLQHPGTSPVDFIRTLTPIRVDAQTVPRQGYLTYMYFYYTFEVFCSINSTWYKITEVNSNQQKLTEYLYNPTRLVEQVQKNYTASNPSSGTCFITPVKFNDIRFLNCSGDVNIDGNLSVGGESILDSVEVSSIKAKYTYNEVKVDGTGITLKDLSSGTQITIEDDGHGNLMFEDGDDSPVNLRNVKTPTIYSDATNKQYVDEQDTSLRNELIGRINSFISTASASGEVCKLVKVLFWYDIDEQVQDFVCDDGGIGIGQTTLNQDETEFNYTFEPSGGASKVEFLTAYYNLYSDPTDIYYTFSYLTHAPINNDTYGMNAVVPFSAGPQSGINKMWFVYLIATSDLNIPELTALRTPYNYSGTIEDYDEHTQYSDGEYCYYPNTTTGELYVCIDQTSGEWDSTCWEKVFARDSIESAFNNRLRLGGQDAMEGNLNMNNHRITNVTNPVNGTDAVTKAYVDNRTFSLDANGILSL